MPDDAQAWPGGRGDGAVAAVVIGRNEGDRLVRCLRSLARAGVPVFYVDSGSTDGSLQAAADTGATVVRLDADHPFTAARARNAGLLALRVAGLAPTYVQFVDGDCEVDPGWIAAARRFLDETPGAAVACGRRRERHPEASPYNRLCDMEWNTPVGEASACGGDALMRLAAFEAVGGYDADLIAGEEPELCLRLRRAGWTVWRLDREMTLHDAAISRFDQWWRRTMRSGWTYAEGAVRWGHLPERYLRAEARSVLLWGVVAPAGLVVLILLSLLMPDPVGTGSAMLAALGVMAWPLMIWRIARFRHQTRGDPWPHALLYGVFTMLGKGAQALGMVRWAMTVWRGQRARLIEYKA